MSEEKDNKQDPDLSAFMGWFEEEEPEERPVTLSPADALRQKANQKRARETEEMNRANASCFVLHPIIEDALDSAGHPMESNLWEHMLDEIELQARACVMEEVESRLFPENPNFPLIFPEFADVDETQLRVYTAMVMTMYLIALKRIREQ